MEVSRIIFRKETKEKMEQGLRGKALGRVRLEKLKELSDNGKLSGAKNRLDVAHLLGYTEENASNRGAGYGWVSNMVSKGYLVEAVNGFDRDGSPNYLYYLSSKVASYGGRSKRADRKKKAETSRYTFNQPIKVEQPKVVEPVKSTPIEPVVTATLGNKITKVTVTYGDVVVGVESVEFAMVPELVSDVIAKLKPSQKGE